MSQDFVVTQPAVYGYIDGQDRVTDAVEEEEDTGNQQQPPTSHACIFGDPAFLGGQ